MVKIKKEVEMTLPELIQWGWKNRITEKAFYSNLDGGSVYFDMLQNISIEHEIAVNETFTVEIKESITEETAIPRLLEVRNAIPLKEEGWKDLKILKSYMYGNRTVSEVKNEHSVSIYILNDDMTMTLIWKDGELV